MNISVEQDMQTIFNDAAYLSLTKILGNGALLRNAMDQGRQGRSF